MINVRRRCLRSTELPTLDQAMYPSPRALELGNSNAGNSVRASAYLHVKSCELKLITGLAGGIGPLRSSVGLSGVQGVGHTNYRDDSNGQRAFDFFEGHSCQSRHPKVAFNTRPWWCRLKHQCEALRPFSPCFMSILSTIRHAQTPGDSDE